MPRSGLFPIKTGWKPLPGALNNFLEISLQEKKSVVYLHSNNAESF
jgi:hypothetical protein